MAALAIVSAVAAGCGGGGDKDSSSAAETNAGTKAEPAADVSGSISMMGGWTGDEQKSVEAVIAGFNAKYPNVKVSYKSGGDNLAAVLSTAVEGGSPPDLASISQPGLIKQFEQKGALKPLDFAAKTVQSNFPPDVVKLGTIDGKLYSLAFKAANKSTVWYNVAAFKNAGVTAPETWDDLREDAKTIKASGLPAYSIGGADGWTLTDLFENVYLRQAGPEKYDELSNHQIKWTDPSVKAALRSMAQILGDASNIAGGTSGALQTDFPTSVSNVFTTEPKAAMVLEGDFVPGVVASKTTLKPGTGYNVFAFPGFDGPSKDVIIGPDSTVMFKDTPAARAFVEYLATPEAAAIWAARGGFSSANKNLSPDAYSDDITRATATAIAEAQTLRVDMSDLAPAAFGGTPGQGEWKILQDFLKDPTNIDGTASALEAAAAKAFRQ